MASPCEILVDSSDEKLASELLTIAFQETKRIESKFSRYLPDNLMSRINNSEGRRVSIDEETFGLLSFADTCFEISRGMFDVTSGVLRKVWKFDGSDHVPKPSDVAKVLSKIGWKQIQFDANSIVLPPDFEIDFGGIGKEYAVDRVAKLCAKHSPEHSVLINFGGDIQVTNPRKEHPYWQVGIEDPRKGNQGKAIVNIASGGLATSGDANRYLLKGGIRYSHILNPKTGFPVVDAPRSITVAAQHCIQSGMLATLSLLEGRGAEKFLRQQDVAFWCFK